MLLDLVCVGCGGAGSVVCARCALDLDRAPSLPCPRGLDTCRAAFDYRPARHLVTALKNGDRRGLVGWFADAMAPLLEPPAGTVVTWAPTATSRRRGRGFDQAELLARAVARRWGCPCRPLLRRLPGPSQSGRSAAQRRSGPAFRARLPVTAPVVVVDDVATTGATLAAAAGALRAAGAPAVAAVVAARAGRLR